MCSESHNGQVADDAAPAHDPAMHPTKTNVGEPSHVIGDDQPFGRFPARATLWIVTFVLVPFWGWLAVGALACQRERVTNEEHRTTQTERFIGLQTEMRDIARELKHSLERHSDVSHPPTWVVRVLDQHERKFETLGVVLNKIGQDVAATKAAVASMAMESKQ